MKTASAILVTALTGFLLAGCQAGPEPAFSPDTTKYSVESTGKFARLDAATELSITCTGLQERLDEAGRLEVVANIKNRENRRVTTEVRCVFKDANGFSTGNETVWRPLVLDAGATAAVRYTAPGRGTRWYTVMVRGAR